MKRMNLHIHSEYSWDSKMKISDIVRILVEHGISYAAITDHVEFDRETMDYIRYKFFKRSHELNEMNKQYEGKIKILSGVEISEPQCYKEQVQMLTDKFDFDFVMGSIHHIPNLKTSKNKKYVTYLYYREMLEMIENGMIDVVGHLDYINKYYHGDYSDPNQIAEVLHAIKEHNQIIEINTSAERRAGLNLFPNLNKICLYKLVSDYVTIGTDAHKENELVDNLDSAEYICEELGLQPVIFEKRKRKVL